MKLIVLDASAILSLINNETGAQEVASILQHAVISSVNMAEIVSILTARYDIPIAQVRSLMSQLIENVVNFTQEHAYIVADIECINMQNKYNLSLGDKACLALGAALGAKIYTADKVWASLSIPNIEVHLIR